MQYVFIFNPMCYLCLLFLASHSCKLLLFLILEKIAFHPLLILFQKELTAFKPRIPWNIPSVKSYCTVHLITNLTSVHCSIAGAFARIGYATKLTIVTIMQLATEWGWPWTSTDTCSTNAAIVRAQSLLASWAVWSTLKQFIPEITKHTARFGCTIHKHAVTEDWRVIWH